ncbi:UNVERIFIED_CONTAM: Small nuclear ribonucleoprotein E [Sesamum angustifolium]|uniref:Small nuclear ribonucleoprotein E n=1 Tax=Sesamum angustifolium TaxID=2727405 RepID=A0AAW2PVK3_9LAMI
MLCVFAAKEVRKRAQEFPCSRAQKQAAMASTKVQRIMTQPINLIFRFLQSKARIQIWLFEQKDLRIEGRIIGFDEYMNLVLDDAEEVNVKKNSRKQLGRILLKGG